MRKGNPGNQEHTFYREVGTVISNNTKVQIFRRLLFSKCVHLRLVARMYQTQSMSPLSFLLHHRFGYTTLWFDKMAV